MAPNDKKKLQISPMRAEHVAEMLWVEQSSFRDPWSQKLFEDELKNPDLSHFLVAQLDGHVVGYMGFWLIQDEAHITNLAVHPAFRRQKIGLQLLRDSMRLAIRLGAKRATLEVRESNHPAKQLYETNGFKLIAVRPKYYADNNEDALIMWNNDLEIFYGTKAACDDKN